MSCCKYLISVIFTFCLFHYAWPSCVFHDGKYDLSALDWPGGWKASSPMINDSVTRYDINICNALNYTNTMNGTGCLNSAVCQIIGNESISFGDALLNDSNYAVADHVGHGFTLYLHTKDSCGGSNEIYRSSINFACGPNLGFPELLLRTKCQINFYWRTSAACPVKTKGKQVPCYVIDEDGGKHDLSHLIAPSGGHFVSTTHPATDFVINVCSNILPDKKTEGCPADAAACRIAGSEKLNFGYTVEGLQSSKEGLLLTYKTNKTSNPYFVGCRGALPKTTILFKCPERGFSQPPKVISDLNCHYEVVWETEYACSENLLKANIKTCQFTMENHGVEIDLSPLTLKPQYIVPSVSSNATSFAFKVCGGLENFNCGIKVWKSTSVCMLNPSNRTNQVVGTNSGNTLMYADNEVTLTYPRGAPCDDGNGQHSTVIKFICDPEANNSGDGEPRHVSSDKNCVHLIEWPTKHACLKHALEATCYVTVNNKKKINLQKLRLVDGEAWEAVDRRMVSNPDNAEYYINVCGQVSDLGNLTKCGESSSACVLLSDGSYLNLGNFTSPPTYDNASNSVRLEYTGGSPCRNDTRWRSTIDFICRPGRINLEPVLTRIDRDECVYEFEWQTAEACPEGIIEGSNCKVFDSSLGIDYDLNPLRSRTYKVDTEMFEFFVGVCEPVADSPCSKNPNSTGNVGVCQVDKSQQKSWKTGEPSSHLSYTDGVVNLTYRSGDSYGDLNNTARMTVIIFICDYKAGNGSPYFVEEVDFATVFHWNTNLVCPISVSTECLAHDPISHLIYDLSGLSISNDNWITFISEDDKERQIYLNVCRSLTRPSVCDPSAAACIVETTKDGEKKAVVSNIGRATSGPVIVNPGHLSLTYTQGNPCVAYGANTTYSTVIHFLCGDGMSKNGPMFLNKLGACEYAFLWTTKAACPTRNLLAKESCELTDPDSGFTFDLTSLRLGNEFYSVQGPKGIIQFDVCGKIVNGCNAREGKTAPSKNISVCEVDTDDFMISEIASANSYNLTYSVGQDLILTYKSDSSVTGGDMQEVLIKFPCYNGTVDAKPKFIRHEGNRYILEMPTRLTCIPTHFDCTTVDGNGNEYDLNPLAKFTFGNWEVGDFKPERSHLRYHINFCRPLVKTNSYKCPGGASSACRTSTLEKNSSGYDLGYQTGPPIVTDEGTILIRYTNGSFCDTQIRRSTTIELFCSQVHGNLMFLGETPECESMFSLDTPVACPIRTSLGSSCKVRDPIFGYMFDLNPLKSKNNNYNITHGEHKYSFNVCDKLNGFDGKCAQSSACQTKPGTPDFSKSLGLPSDNLVYRKGLITLEYESGTGSCHKQYNRSTIITFTCHHGHEDKDGPIFISETEDCTYLFEWPTVHACPPFDVIECSVVDENGITYDLSKLSLPNDNYYMKNPLSETGTFVLNLCRSVVHTPNSLCAYTSGACLVDNDSSVLPINLGRVQNMPYIENGRIKINYTTGDYCNEGAGPSTRFWETVIEFTCDRFGLELEPQFVGKDDCTYYFDWLTTYACPPKPVEVTDDCTVKDPNTGFLYNLSSLQDKLHQTQVGHHQYYINVCSNSIKNPCGPNAGMCQEEMSNTKRKFNGGDINSRLTFNDGILFLNYSSGDSCHNGHYQRNTIIEFHCGVGIGEPKFVHESHNCTYFFSWGTELACQETMHCGVENGNQYFDLSSLSQSYYTASSSIMNEDSVYYLSVCSSLPNIRDAHCPVGSAICKVKKSKDDPRLQSLSLGRAEHPPMMDFMGHVTVLYTNGTTCDKNNTLQNRARIIFICDSEVGMGEPVRVPHDDDCMYLFEWRTNLVCAEKEIDEGIMSCNYTDIGRGIHFDLTPLRKNSGPYEVTNERDGGKFLLQICSSLQPSNITNCEKSGICAVGANSSTSYGTAASQKFSFDSRRLTLRFYDGDDCPSGIKGKRTSDVLFVCDPTAGFGQPFLHKKYTCMVVFMWRTSLVCQHSQRLCSFNVGPRHYDFTLLSSLSHNWNASNSQNTYWINLCSGILPTPATFGCPPTSAICMMNNEDSHITLGTVQSMQAKAINSTDLELVFQSGDKRACANVSSPMPLTPTTRIFMRCGKILGSPKFYSGPDQKCFYDFIWESSLACEDQVEQVMMEKDGIIKDPRFNFSVNITDILNRTLTVPGTSGSDQYVYEINLSGVQPHSSGTQTHCSQAAICQTKPNNNFYRDVGSFDTRTFTIRRTELYLSFVSHTRPCGKNKSKNVTSVIIMQCSSAAGIGKPVFFYESGNCDYLFEWQTIAVCSDFHKPKTDDDGSKGDNISPDHYKEAAPPSHNAEIIIGVIFLVLILMVVGFIVAKPERRARISHRVRSAFGRVNLPYFRYKRGDILTELQSDF